MSASLVGSEMCIRDSYCTPLTLLEGRQDAAGRAARSQCASKAICPGTARRPRIWDARPKSCDLELSGVPLVQSGSCQTIQLLRGEL
eukprot:14849435-Alexandrium_andersonii.AAC.1